LAVAGFGESEIDITIDGGKLIVKGNVDTSTDDIPEDNFLFKGIATRAFTRAFAIDDHIEVKNAELFNGMLKIALERLVPEEAKPKKVPVNVKGKKTLLQENDYDKAAESL
jgi:molecular chaperone IbpA